MVRAVEFAGLGVGIGREAAALASTFSVSIAAAFFDTPVEADADTVRFSMRFSGFAFSTMRCT